MSFDTDLKRLRKGLARLTSTKEAGRVARANGRRAVFTALSALRREVDREFPAIAAKPTKTPLAQLTDAGFERRMVAKGYVEVAASHIREALLEGRAPMRKRKVFVSKDSNSTRWVYWAPRWAIIAATKGAPAVRKAKADLTYRAALMAQVSLGVYP